MFRAVCLAAIVCLLPACSTPPARDALPVPRPVPGLPPVPGRVHAVNPGLKFAIIDYTLGGAPAEGDRLNAWRGGQKVAELRVSGQSRDGFVAADILSGALEPGDEVRP